MHLVYCPKLAKEIDRCIYTIDILDGQGPQQLLRLEVVQHTIHKIL